MKLPSTLLFALALCASAHAGGDKHGGTHGDKHGGKGGRSRMGPPKCADGANPTCFDIDGIAITLPLPRHRDPSPIMDGHPPPRPNCTCADGSTPTPPKCKRGRALRGKRGSRDKESKGDHGNDDEGCDGDHHRHRPSPAAVCLGVTGGLVALAAAVFFVRRRRRTRTAVQETLAKPSTGVPVLSLSSTGRPHSPSAVLVRVTPRTLASITSPARGLLPVADVAQEGDLPTATGVASTSYPAGDMALQKKLETVVLV
jgi:hypothetical protein